MATSGDQPERAFGSLIYLFLYPIRTNENGITTYLLLLLSLAGAAQPTTRQPVPAGRSVGSTAEILWDSAGVPHIYGQTLEAMYYGFGYAQMENHANLLLRLYGQARGRAAEYWGQPYVDSDKIVTLFGISQQAQQQYAQQPADYKGCLDSFVTGLNAYAKAHPETIGAEFKPVLPITPQDVLAHISRVICLEFMGLAELGYAQVMPPGSNAYAIAPSKSASKKAMLLANPHLEWANHFLFFEAHLNGPGFMAYGACLVGQPVLNIAFTNQLGWTIRLIPLMRLIGMRSPCKMRGIYWMGLKSPSRQRP